MAFKAGQSGNPSGRPIGCKDKRTIFRDMVEPNSAKLINKAVEMALEGNESMLRLLLDRILPVKPKDDLVCIDINSDSLIGHVNIILEEIGKGNLTIATANILMNIVAVKARIIETEELEKRIQILEQVNKIGLKPYEFIEEPDYNEDCL